MLSGGCDCRGCRYELAAQSPLPIYACHCRRCQTRSGSAFALHMMIAADELTLQGETKSLERSQDQVTFEETFCAQCFTRLFNRNSLLPETLFLRAGTLVDSAQLVPMVHIWTKRKQPWVQLPDSAATFVESPSPEEFTAAVAAVASAYDRGDAG